MKFKRRGLVGGASALAVAAVSSSALGRSKHMVSAPGLVGAAADASDFEAALRAKFVAGDVLNWTGGNVRLKRPIHIDVTKTILGAGVDLNGAKIIADFHDATRRAITIRVPPGYGNVSVRGLKVMDGTFVAESPAADALGFLCTTNRSWINSWKLMNLDIEGFGRDGLFFAGNVFEGELHGVTCASNGRNGITFRNDGAQDDWGLVSAIAIFGGQMRKNGNAGIETQAAITYREPRDINIRQTYFVENKGPGLNAVSGFSRAEGCGFLNNGECGINMMNEGRMIDCQGGTHGVQPYLVKAFLNGGRLNIDSCRIEGFSGFEGKMRMGKISGRGTVNLHDSGQVADLDISGDIAVNVSSLPETPPRSQESASSGPGCQPVQAMKTRQTP